MRLKVDWLGLFEIKMIKALIAMTLSLTSAGVVQLEEELPKTPLQVEGEVPSYVEGTLFRNGPALFEKGDEAVAHPFDGLAMLHAFSIHEGTVTYQNRFLQSTPYLAYKKEGTLSFSGFATDPCRKVFSEWQTTLIQNANVSIVEIASEACALTETPLPVRFDRKTLETLGVLEFADDLPKDDCFESAHPHVDPESQDYYNYQVVFGSPSHYQIYRIAHGSTERIVLANIPVESPSYMHSFALTEHYLVMAEFPLVLDAKEVMKGKPFITAFRWEPERGTRYLVIDRQSGKLIQTLTGEAYFSFHHINAYEEGGDLILDLVTFADPALIFGKRPSLEKRGVMRVHLALSENRVTTKMLYSGPCELPRLPKMVNGKPYRYAYLVDYRMVPSAEDAPPVMKLDVTSGKILSWSQKGCIPGEPIFIPKPDRSDEDGGLLLTVVLDVAKGCSFLLVLDAATLEELARAYAPHAIPAGLHGDFLRS